MLPPVVRLARRPITALTLAGGFASTVSWPVVAALAFIAFACFVLLRPPSA